LTGPLQTALKVSLQEISLKGISVDETKVAETLLHRINARIRVQECAVHVYAVAEKSQYRK